MSTKTSRAMPPPGGTAAPAPVPTLDEIYRLTERPDERVVFRNVDWAFYEQFADSIPESTNIHVDYDGKDLEVMAKGQAHKKIGRRVGRFIDIVMEESGISFLGLAQTTWKRPAVSRGLEADECYYFLPEKLDANAAAEQRGSKDTADYPNPDLAVEVDISPPKVDRAGIYAALRVTEVWRITERQVVIERLTRQGRYRPVNKSGFLAARPDDIQRWVLEEDWRDEMALVRKLRAELRKERQRDTEAEGFPG